MKPFKRFPFCLCLALTGLKPGANEKLLKSKTTSSQGLFITSFSFCRYNVALAKAPVDSIYYIQAQTGVCVKVNNYELSGRRLGVAREPTYALSQARTT